MIKTNVFIADPYNERHIELYKNFEKKNNLSTVFSNYLEDLSLKLSKDEYLKKEQISNDNITNLFIENEQGITDCCQITYEKDRKTAYIYYPNLEEKRRKIIAASTTYAFNNLGMEEVFVSVDEKDNKLINDLEYNSFESLGQGKPGTIEFIKEQSMEKDSERSRLWK